MSRFLLICILPLLYNGLCYGNTDLAKQPLKKLEQQLADINSELTQLATLSLRSGTGSIGFRSKSHTNANAEEWIQVHLPPNSTFDSIVLVPTIWRHTVKGFVDDGFPQEFQIIAGLQGETNGNVIATQADIKYNTQRIAPFIFSCPNTTADWIRIEALKLVPRNLDGKYIFQLAECLVFDGEENIALHQSITASSRTAQHSKNWQHYYLVDGFMPYLMNAATGHKSLPFIARIKETDARYLQIDLGEVMPISRLHIHTVDKSDTIPQGAPGDLGFPRKLNIEGATQPDFSDAVLMLEYDAPTALQTGPIMMWNLPETPCRYVRLNILEPYLDQTAPHLSHARFGLAELELFSKGKNVALKKEISFNFHISNSSRSISALTDGHNLYGKILPIREWLTQLARRHDLEIERPQVQAELKRRYTSQKVKLRRMKGLFFLLIIGIGASILIDRLLLIRQATQTRERFAADLHDELGATNHAIGLLSDAASQADDSPEERKMLHQRIRMMTERNGRAIRSFSSQANSNELYSHLAEDIKRSANRITANLEHQITIEGERYLEHLPSRVRQDLFLFFKESLINICRHSNASEFKTHLIATPKDLTLSISDNGTGLPGQQVPPSLKRRAKLLKAKVSILESPNGGAHISLKLITHRWFHRLNFKLRNK